MSTPQLVNLVVSAVAGADGVATVRFNGPGMIQEVLHVDAISVRSDSAALPDATLYRGAVATGRRIAYNPDGRSGSFRGGAVADVIDSSDWWELQWTKCTPGALCSASLSGYINRRR